MEAKGRIAKARQLIVFLSQTALVRYVMVMVGSLRLLKRDQATAGRVCETKPAACIQAALHSYSRAAPKHDCRRSETGYAFLVVQPPRLRHRLSFTIAGVFYWAALVGALVP